MHYAYRRRVILGLEVVVTSSDRILDTERNDSTRMLTLIERDVATHLVRDQQEIRIELLSTVYKSTA